MDMMDCMASNRCMYTCVIALLTLLFSEHIKSLTVTSDPANPKEGDSQVKLVATTAQGTGDVTWLLNEKPLPNDSRYEISGTSLVIKNVTRQDTGLYTCILKNPFSNDTFNKNITIFYGPENPQIVVTVDQSVSTENFVKVGDWLSLTCQAVGDPAPSYFWSSESQKNITGSQSGVLSLKNIQTNQSGVYTCVMTNPVTSVSIEKNYTVNVYASPSGDPICSVKAVQSNTALEYQCSWMSGTPLALLQFTLPNATQGGGYLNHTEVASPSLNGQNVTCIGTHPIVSKNCSIVAGSPDGIFPLLTTTMDSSGALVVTISCASTFLPQPTVQWSKNNQVLNNGGNFAISGDTSQLTISNFNINGGDLTTYTCNNVNPLGAKSNSMTLRGPMIGDSSLFPNKQGTIVTLTWETPRDSVITGFDIQMKGPDLRRSKRSTNEFTTLQMTGASNHSLDIFGLHPKSTYRFRIIPLAGQTQGAPSQEHRIGPGEGLNGAAIAGIAAGIPCSIFLLLFVLVLIILCVVCAVKRKRREQSYPVTKTNGTVVETDPEKSKTKTGVTGQLKDEEKPFSLPSYVIHLQQEDGNRYSTQPSAVSPPAVRVATTV